MENEPTLNTNNPMVEGYYDNTQSNVIRITEDKLRNILNDNKGALSENKDRIGPLILMITIALIFCTTDFKFDHTASILDFKNNMILYVGFLFIALSKSIQWFYIAFKNNIKVISIDELIFKVRNQKIESIKSNNVFMLLLERFTSFIGYGTIRIKVPKIKIHSARYGSGNHWKDITLAIKKQIANNELYIDASNSIWGDPNPGVNKQLEIDFTLNGKRNQQTINENHLLYVGGNEI